MTRCRLALVLTLGGCAPAGADTPEPDGVLVQRGRIATHMLLTGEIDAAVSSHLFGPRTEDWNLAIRWLAEDGARVAKGDRVVGFDNVAVTSRIQELELAVVEAGSARLEQDAKAEVENADKDFARREKLTAVDKAEVDARVPAELLSRKEARKFALDRDKAVAARADAESDLDTGTRTSRLSAELKRLAYDKAVRKLEAAREQLASLDLYAPQDGVVLIGEQPWEGRKLQVGDNVWPGMTVARLPDLDRLVVMARLDDVDDGRIQPGMAASITVDAYPQTPMPGHVVAVGQIAHELAQQSTRRYFTVTIELETIDTAVLRPGLSVLAEIDTGVIEDVLVAPRQALDTSVTPPRARLRDGRELEVELGACDARLCEIRSGLAEGDALAQEDR